MKGCSQKVLRWSSHFDRRSLKSESQYFSVCRYTLRQYWSMRVHVLKVINYSYRWGRTACSFGRPWPTRLLRCLKMKSGKAFEDPRSFSGNSFCFSHFHASPDRLLDMSIIPVLRDRQMKAVVNICGSPTTKEKIGWDRSIQLCHSSLPRTERLTATSTYKESGIPPVLTFVRGTLEVTPLSRYLLLSALSQRATIYWSPFVALVVMLLWLVVTPYCDIGNSEITGNNLPTEDWRLVVSSCLPRGTEEGNADGWNGHCDIAEAILLYRMWLLRQKNYTLSLSTVELYYDKFPSFLSKGSRHLHMEFSKGSDEGEFLLENEFPL